MSNLRAKSLEDSASFKSAEEIEDIVIGDFDSIIPDSIILEDGAVYSFKAHDTIFADPGGVQDFNCPITLARLSIGMSADRAKTWDDGEDTTDTACSDSNNYLKYIEGTFNPELPADIRLFRFARIAYNTNHYTLWVQEYAPSRTPNDLIDEKLPQPFSGYLAKYFFYNKETLGVSQGVGGQSFPVSGDLIKTPTNGTPVVTVNGVPWTRVADFGASTATSKHFTYDPAEGRVTFGNGTAGMIPPAGHSIVLRLRLDGGGVWTFIDIAKQTIGETKAIGHTSAIRNKVYFAQAEIEGGRVRLSDVTSKLNQKRTVAIGNQTGTVFSRQYQSDLDYGGTIDYNGSAEIVNSSSGSFYSHTQAVPAGVVPGSAVLTGGGFPSGSLSAVGSPSVPVPNWKLPIEGGYKTSTKHRIRLFFHYMTKIVESQVFFIQQPDPAPPNPPNFITVAAPSYSIEVRAQGGASQYSTYLNASTGLAPSGTQEERAKMIAVDLATVWFSFHGKNARLYATNSNENLLLATPIQVGDVYMGGVNGTDTAYSTVFIPGVGILSPATTEDTTHYLPLFFTNFPVLPSSPALAGTWTNPSTGEIRTWSPVFFSYQHPTSSTRRLDLAFFKYRSLAFAAGFAGGQIAGVSLEPAQYDISWLFDEGTILIDNIVVDESL